MKAILATFLLPAFAFAGNKPAHPGLASDPTIGGGMAPGPGITPAPGPGKTIVHEVEQAATTRPMTWTHRVAESGDYQLGMAWIEVLEGGEVDVSIRAGGKPIRSVVARPGPAPQRLEVRIEGLQAGEEISIATLPKQANYRIGYQIAITTPSFPGARIFHVGDFGAMGDGQTDDFLAIQKTVAAARVSGCAIVRFDGSRVYRAIGKQDFTEEALLDLKGARNLRIEGGGAMVVLHPPDSFAMLDGAENIQIDGFRIDYEPKPYYQGMIRKIDVEAMTIDIEVPERYPVPEVGRNEFRAPFFGRSFIPDAPGSRSGSGDNIYIENVSRLDGERRLRIQVRENAHNSDTPDSAMKPRIVRAAAEGATEFVVPHVKFAHRGHVNRINASSRVTLSNLHYGCSPHFWSTITHNTGPITLRNVDLKMPHPETELFVSWRDGLHIKNGRWGILIEDCDWDGAATYDDSFAIYSRAQELVAVAGNTMTLRPTFERRETFLWQKGDWAGIWSPGQRQLRGMARVLDADATPVDQTFKVTLESMPSGAAEGDIVLHEESLNRGTLIRNCTTSDIGTENSSTRFRCVDVRFQNNHFDDFHFWFHAGPNGPRPRDIVLENNQVSGTENRRLDFQQGLDCQLRGNRLHGLTVELRDATTGVILEGNRWSGLAPGQMEVRRSNDSEVVHAGGP